MRSAKGHRKSPRFRSWPIACALALPATVIGCADTVNPAAGGLRIGVQNAPLKPPVRVDSLHPFEYPPSAWSYGASGTTVLKILISETGSVDSAFVLQSSGDRALDSAAIANSRHLVWEPAEQGGNPIRIWGRLPVIYPRPEERPDEP
ncbi:MAG: energy transducer TonB [Gemmatimonadetes bacterium]|nr:energy transducer TonB [Gemmatimonadota bacterium]